MPSHDTYTVFVEFTTPTERDIAPEFADAQQFERVGVDHYQVGYTVAAPTPAEAYRRTANLCESPRPARRSTTYGAGRRQSSSRENLTV